MGGRGMEIDPKPPARCGRGGPLGMTTGAYAGLVHGLSNLSRGPGGAPGRGLRFSRDAELPGWKLCRAHRANLTVPNGPAMMKEDVESRGLRAASIAAPECSGQGPIERTISFSKISG
jgi:hypothetical protein